MKHKLKSYDKDHFYIGKYLIDLVVLRHNIELGCRGLKAERVHDIRWAFGCVASRAEFIHEHGTKKIDYYDDFILYLRVLQKVGVMGIPTEIF